MSVSEDKFLNAASAGDLDKIKSCVAQGVDINCYEMDRYTHWSSPKTAIEICCSKEHFDCVEFLLMCDGIKMPEIRHAYPVLQKERYDLIEKMVMQGLDLNDSYVSRGDTICNFLIFSVWDQNINAIDFLTSQESINIDAFFMDNNPLHSAFMAQHTDIKKLLLDRGANINAQNNRGETILMHLAQKAGEGILREFLSLNPDLDIRDHSGMTFLDHAHEGVKDFVETFRLSKEIDVVTFSYRHGSRVIQDVFNFHTHEKMTFVRKGMTGPIEAMTQMPFEKVPAKSLQMAFNEHKKRGGTTKPDDIGVIEEMKKPKSSGVLHYKNNKASS